MRLEYTDYRVIIMYVMFFSRAKLVRIIVGTKWRLQNILCWFYRVSLSDVYDPLGDHCSGHLKFR